MYCVYHGLSRWYLRSRFRWIDAGTARSVTWKGLPLICLIIVNVKRMTRRITGIVHRKRLMMNLTNGYRGVSCPGFRLSGSIAPLAETGGALEDRKSVV